MPEQKKVNTLAWMNEYFYAESVRQFNMNRVSVGLPLVSTTQARKLHDSYMVTFSESYAKNFDGIYNNPKFPAGHPRRDAYIHFSIGGLMTAAFNTAFSELNGKRPYYSRTAAEVPGYNKDENYFTMDYEDSRAIRSSILNHFEENSGWNVANVPAYEDGTMEIPVENCKLCISPYDNRFSTRQVVLDNGGRIIWTDSENFIDSLGNYEEDVNKQVRLYAESLDENGMPIAGSQGKYCGNQLITDDDKTGISRLRPYMSNTDYNKVKATIQNAYAKPGVEPMSAEGLDRSVAILQWLTDNGYTYRIMNDTNPGQLKAKIGNSKLEIRIMDTKKNEAYIGRCYEEGFETFFNRPSGKNAQHYKEATIDDTLNLISYVLGNKVERKEYNSGSIESAKRGDVVSGVKLSYDTEQLGVQRVGEVVGAYAGEPAHIATSRNRNGYTYRDTYDVLDGRKKDDDVHFGSTVLLDVELGDVVPGTSYKDRRFAVAQIRSNHHSSHEYFDTQDEANNFLTSAINSARQNYMAKLDVERLIEEAALHVGEPDYVPEFSYDPNIQPIQVQYWEVLSGKRDLYRFDATADDVRSEIEFEEYDESGAIGDMIDSIFGNQSSLQYEGDVADQVRQHVNDVVDFEFGTLEPSEEDGLRFNPANVATFMDSAFSTFRNNDNLVEALKVMDIPAEELRGNEFQVNQIKDKLIKFNPETAHPLLTEDASPFMKAVHQTVLDTVATSHCTINPEDVLIDDNGIIHYTATRHVLRDKNVIADEPVVGTVGQVFEPDEDGVVETKFNGSQNQLFSPGYMAYVLPQAEGESKTLPERMRLKGYLHVVQENLRKQIRMDLMDNHDEVGSTTSVNNSYRGLYETRYKVHGLVHEGETLKDAYLRECQMTGLPEDVVKARFETFNGMIRLPSDFKEDSSLNAAFAHDSDNGDAIEDVMNDNGRDAWQLSGGENISILSTDWDGYTDKTATGSAKNQGAVRYMVRGAHVDENGVLHPALNEDGTINKNARTALMEIEDMKFVEHTPFDRQQMVFSNLSGASAISRGTGVLAMTAGGYTFDDGCIISKAWAVKNGPMGEDGVRRPLKPGDKILDMAGNKSIVGKIVDTDVSDEDFAKLDKTNQELVKLVRDNPGVDVIVSPYSPMSRFNATTACFGINDNFEVTLPDGRKTYGGRMPVVVTDKTVDEKTKEYGDDEVKAGGGRSASGQFNWILSSKGAFGLMDECYGNTESSWAAYREYLIAMGMDMSETGELTVGYQPHQDENRNLFKLPELDELDAVNAKSAAEAFKGAVDNRGGFLEVPVQLTLPSGEKLQPVPAGKSAYGDANQTYMLPILSSYLRSGQEFQDGTSTTHDYTNHYAQIYKYAVEYTAMYNSTDGYNPDDLKKLAGKMQSEYSEITSDIDTRIFTGKHNYVRDHLMSNRLPHSSTAVWTAEPACAIDEIRMPVSMAKTLGVKEGDMVLGWRDPCLHESSLSGFHVVIDTTPAPNELTGVAVNPLIASRMDGDFDGDSIGLYGVSSEAGKRDLEEHFAIHNTLLDRVHKKENGDYELFINTKMDVKSLYAVDEERRAKAEAEGHPIEGPSFRERFDALETKTNDIYARRGDYAEMSDEQINEAKKAVCNEISDWTHELFDSCPLGAQMLSMESPAAYAKDLVHMADTKAKGKMSSIEDVMKYLGATYDMHEDENGNKVIDYDSIKMTDETFATRQDAMDTMFATAVKANGTPLGGQFSLNIAEITRNTCLGHALDLTYNATQAALQAKHDALMAKQQYHMLQGALKSQWRGHKLESYNKPVMTDSFDEKGNPIQAVGDDGKPLFKKAWKEVKTMDQYGNEKPVPLTTDEWVKQFMEIHTDPDGMNLDGDVNIEQVKLVAKALTDASGHVYDIESKDARNQLGATMDRLAYQPSLDATIEAARNHESMLDGTANFHLGPKTIRENIKAMQTEHEGDVKLKGFSKSDVIEHTEPRKDSAYEQSSHYVHENKKGLGHAITGGYTAPEDRPVEDPMDMLKPEDREAYESGSWMHDDKDESVVLSATEEEKAAMYANLSVEDREHMSDEEFSEIARAAQEAAEDRRFDDYDDNIDDCVVEKPKSDSVSEDLQSALAAKAAEERVARHPDESKPAKSPDEQQDAVFSSAEAATTKVPTTDGKTSPVDD